MSMPITLSDGEAKQRMRELWPVYAPGWLGGNQNWVRLLPFPVQRGPRQPYLHHPGGALVTNPDGMMGAFGEHHVDLLVLEHCGSLQNFYDKRSRYAMTHDGLLLALPRPWREDWLGLIHGGQGGRWVEFGDIVEMSRGQQILPPWVGCSFHPSATQHQDDWKFAVRSVMCCYFLAPHDLQVIRTSGNLFPRHEFVTQHGRIGQITHLAFRNWLQQAIHAQQVY
jgi:hypothetical protein